MRITTLLSALTLALAAPAWAAPVTQDTPGQTSAGATFTIPRDWSGDPKGGAFVLAAPEGDLTLRIVEVGKAADATSAAAAAWKQVDPGFDRPLRIVNANAPGNGWDERGTVEYETSPNEKLFVAAAYQRKGDQWTVGLLHASLATLEKRGAAVSAVTQSLRPAGYVRESFADKTAHPLDAARIEALKSFVRESMGPLGVPGVGFALIEKGRIVYEGGIGVKEAGKPDPVDAHTLFMVASNTKGMATLLLSRLVDQGKLRWDEPVTQVYPQFRLGSAETTRQVLVRHLVCACTGLPRKDFNWIFNTPRNTPASTTFDQLAGTEPTSKFDEVFQYNNLMASAAGYIGGHILYPKMELGAAFDRAMDAEIFGPLGMKDTTFDFARAMRGDWARPHGDGIIGQPTLADQGLNYAVLPYRPAGGAWSSAHDMALYVINEMLEGRTAAGKQLFSAENLLARRKRGVPVGEDRWYGMGVQEDLRNDVSIIHHGGSMGGYKSDWFMLPKAQVGVVILTNSDNGYYLLNPMARRLLEVLYDGKDEAASQVAASATRIKAELADFKKRLVTPPGADALALLGARYSNAELGTFTVRSEGKATIFDFGTWKSQVSARRNDDGTTSFLTTDPTNEGFDFVAGERDGKKTLTTRDSQHEYVFTAG